MKSIRDLVNRMPETRKGLEEYALGYSPAIKDAIERDPHKRQVLTETVDESFDKYSKYLGGLTHKISAAGHAIGYTADAWLATGDIVGSLGGKFLHLLAQIPEKAYSVVYAARTGNYLDSLKNIFEGTLSYLPGFTVLDEGLSRIVQKRMARDVIYNTEKKLGLDHTSWHARYAKQAEQAGYSEVKDREDNIIKVDFSGEKKLKRAA